MNLLRLFLASMITTSMVGCCCTNHCAMTNPCDPCNAICAQEYSSCSSCSSCGKFSFPKLRWPFSGGSRCSCNSVCDGDSYGGFVDSGCGSSNCGGGCAGNCGAPTMNANPVSSGCGCSQAATFSGSPASTYQNHVPSQPTTIPPMPPASGNGAPAPSAGGSETNYDPNKNGAMNSPAATKQTVMVSYEEFQRLPGKIVSGPGSSDSSSVPQSIQQVTATIQPAVAPLPPPPAPAVNNSAKRFYNPSQTSQAVWNPSNQK